MRYAVIVALLALVSGQCWADVDAKSYARWDAAGFCRPNGFMVGKAYECLTWAAASQCDAAFGLRQSWRTGIGRDEAWLRCATGKLDQLVANYNAARQATGEAMMRAGQTMIERDNAGRNVTCTRTSPSTVNCSEW